MKEGNSLEAYYCVKANNDRFGVFLSVFHVQYRTKLTKTCYHGFPRLVNGSRRTFLKDSEKRSLVWFCHCELVSLGQFKKEHGLLLDFAETTLEVKRVICQKAKSFPGVSGS